MRESERTKRIKRRRTTTRKYKPGILLVGTQSRVLGRSKARKTMPCPFCLRPMEDLSENPEFCNKEPNIHG